MKKASPLAPSAIFASCWNSATVSAIASIVRGVLEMETAEAGKRGPVFRQASKRMDRVRAQYAAYPREPGRRRLYRRCLRQVARRDRGLAVVFQAVERVVISRFGPSRSGRETQVAGRLARLGAMFVSDGGTGVHPLILPSWTPNRSIIPIAGGQEPAPCCVVVWLSPGETLHPLVVLSMEVADGHHYTPAGTGKGRY